MLYTLGIESAYQAPHSAVSSESTREMTWQMVARVFTYFESNYQSSSRSEVEGGEQYY